jgi:hypothetical protein
VEMTRKDYLLSVFCAFTCDSGCDREGGVRIERQAMAIYWKQVHVKTSGFLERYQCAGCVSGALKDVKIGVLMITGPGSNRCGGLSRPGLL